MNWVLFGATGAALAKNPQAGERVLDMLIYVVCFILPLMPVVFVGAEKRAYGAIRHRLWAKVSMIVAALFGIVGLIAVGVVFPLGQVSYPAAVVAMTSLVWGLLTIRGAKKGWPPNYDLQDMVSRITPENKHDFTETAFAEPVGREKL